ncbi:non-specific lipid-transfer protein-like 2 isoform X1 [Argiope bruennichi]|uniref:non-specific lipid-transfer protein-like 2 isoform X1 n=2 Tax=Argiope bruennichi TaxID=94029 RepID=UPI0024948F2C|nr:non-specific lipid-transfer protein-like 2 isoform X1 [Argiope bruennichi]
MIRYMTKVSAFQKLKYNVLDWASSLIIGKEKMANNLRKKVYVVGVGMTKFYKPGTGDDYPELAKEAVVKALDDAKISYDLVQQACVGYVYGDSTCGQRALYEVGMSGIPIINVNNNCSTGSTALYISKELVEGGLCDCVLALGFEKMARGSLTSKFDDRTNPMDKHVLVLSNRHGFAAAPVAAQFFGSAGREHMEKYGTKKEHFAKIAYKNHKHSVNNPYSQFRDEYTLEQILNSPPVYEPLTKLQCCPTSDGAAAAILASENFVRAHKLENQAVEIVGMEMTTDVPSAFTENSSIKMIGFDMTRNASNKLFQNAGVRPTDVDVVELHDCFSTNELITYEALGLCDVGKGGELVDTGNNTYGGKYVINPSGGLISKGHPLGATGIAQCAELCWQLRNEAGPRQVPNAKLALQHNIGLGGAVVVALYRRGFQNQNETSTSSTIELPKEMQKLKSSKFFQKAIELLSVAENIIDKKIKGSVKVRVADDNSDFVGVGTMKFDKGKIAISWNPDEKADCIISLTDGVLCEILDRKNTFEKAFFSGKLQIKGNIGFLARFMSMKNALLSKL